MRICFDLHGTLAKHPTNRTADPYLDYLRCEPIEENIELLRQYYYDGHTIIISTASHKASVGHNTAEQTAKIGGAIFQWLIKYRVPYHEIDFSKPLADAYIDDRAVNALQDVETIQATVKALGEQP